METVPLYADVLAQGEEELEIRAEEARAAAAERAGLHGDDAGGPA
jgi:hypothetical protein